jgi:uncharacterized protein YndB with AHSA1/START domain
MTQETQDMTAYRYSFSVPIAPDAAFELFTEGFDSWWPKERVHLSERPCALVALEPVAGGRWYERADDGSECDWGFVREVERPNRILMAWQLDPEWEFNPDPGKATEVEVTFEAEGDGTLVTLEHRGFEVHGEPGAEMREAVGSEGGWPEHLEHYRKAA